MTTSAIAQVIPFPPAGAAGSTWLKQVEHLARAGFAIHRLHAKSKRPIGDDWSTKPVLSFEALKRAYRSGENLGVRLGEPSKVAGGFLHVVDIDIRDPKLAEEAHARMLALLPLWKNYPVVASGSGGYSAHVYLLTSRPFRSKKLAHSEAKIIGADGKSHWGWEIELFGTGKQVVLPPSIHPDTGKPYRWLREFNFSDLDLGFGPWVDAGQLESLVEHEEESDLPDDERQQPLGLTEAEIREVLSDLPAVTYCDDRDGWLSVGMALHHETEGSKVGFDLWCEFSKRSDKFDRKDQARVWRSFKGKSKPLRMATLVTAAREARFNEEFDALDDFDDLDPLPEKAGVTVIRYPLLALFDELLGTKEKAVPSHAVISIKKAEVEAELAHVPGWVARLNRKHAVALINGRTVILTQNSDGAASYGTVTDLHAWYENDRRPTERATEPVSKSWLRHKKRREYPNGVVFAPGEEVEGAYNHWRGFVVEPDAKKSCKLILQHIRVIICKDDEVAYTYFIGWLAHMIQRPGEKPGVAVVLRGLKGTGKDTVGDYVGGLFTPHHVKIAHQDQLTGKFNAHQERALLLHLEEGLWAGNKQAESVLKHLITSEKVQIEPKGLNAFQVKSVLRLFISSNERWVVPATGGERRFFVLNVSDRYALTGRHLDQRGSYFHALQNEMRNGGQAALLHYLQNYDLNGFDVREVPQTIALGEQKVQGLRGFERFWFNRLHEADLGVEALATSKQRTASWPEERIVLDRGDFYSAYTAWLRSRRYDGDPISEAEVGKHLREMLAGLDVGSTRRRGEFSGQRWCWELPHLAECRSAFDRWIGSQIPWSVEA